MQYGRQMRHQALMSETKSWLQLQHSPNYFLQFSRVYPKIDGVTTV